jgi:hypothetical protein
LYWIGGAVTILVGIIILIINLNLASTPTPEAETFCGAFPNALFCDDEEYSDLEIATDMMTTLMAHYPNVMTDTFCENYFTGTLSRYCLEDPDIILPDNFNYLSSSFDIVQIGDNLFDIRMWYSNQAPAYRIHLALNHNNGAYHISGFSYETLTAPTDLEWSDEDVDTFLSNMIDAALSGSRQLCDTYFSWEALSTCRYDADAIVVDEDIRFDYSVTRVDLNTYRYVLHNEEGTESLLYEVMLEERAGIVYISDITVIRQDTTES